ncbi:TonB-dependent receptor [Arenibacter palladensis]|uniref:TonB-dependent receptor n=1 Tax=Arenibacter palladensis TaxID=237373 RepID=UPI0026E3D6A6|nr:TonB-dependent receptor [Arenibacter palladensis]MDO6605651.1 TonB-dependent receptor [Arenibacter palladensis]
MKKLINIGCTSMCAPKWDLKMKLTAFFLLICMLQINATTYSQKTRISLEMKDVQLSEVLNRIETISEFKFFVDTQKIDVKRAVEIKADKEKIFDILDKLFRGTNITYEVFKKQILLKRVDLKHTTPTSVGTDQSVIEIKNQQQTITGTITDGNGSPLPGANILEKGTTNGTQADFDGNFTIFVADENAILVISYIGFVSKEIKTEGATTLDIVLKESVDGLDEVVVVGYGTQKRVNITGAVTSVESEELTVTPVSNTSQALQGRIPGLITRQSSGEPGFDNVGLSIRGFGTPLIIVDGIESSLNRVDPEEIQSISVLKDASAAIYGARAGNGVILVTTKRGLKQKPKITFNGTYSFQTNTAYPELMDAGQYSELIREAQINSGTPESGMKFTEEDVAKYKAGTEPGYEGTNWKDVIMRDYAPMQKYNLSLSGGNENLSYYSFLGYTGQEGIWESGDNIMERYNVRTNFEAKISDNLTATVDISAVFGDLSRPTRETETLLHDLRFHVPTYSSSLPDPDKIPFAGKVVSSLASVTEKWGGYRKNLENNIFTTFSLNYNVPFIKGLEVKALVNYIYNSNESKDWIKAYDQYSYNYDSETYVNHGSAIQETSLTEGYNRSRKLTGQFSLNYNRVFNEKHNLSGIFLIETIDQYGKWFNASRADYITTSLDYLFAGAENRQMADGAANESGRLSYVGRLNYNYEGKYLFETTMRYDGSPNFPSNKRWGFFPSVSAGWRISEENFMAETEWLNNLKLRASFSNMGYDGIGAFQYLSGYKFSIPYVVGGISSSTLINKGLANPNITWEEMSIYNVGFDFSTFQNKLYGEVDAFYRQRENILATRFESLPNTFGAILPHENLNSQNTRGFELLTGYRNSVGQLKYDIAGNVSWSRSKWDHYEEPEYTDPDEIRINQQSGNWTNRYFGYIADGLFSSQEEIDNHPLDQDLQGNSTLLPGDIKYVDQNNDGILDWRDKKEIGSGATPEVMFGLNIGLSYKQFSLSALFQGATRRDFNVYTDLPTAEGNLELIYDKRWTEENNNSNAEIPRQYIGSNTNNSPASTYWLKDGSYVRLKSLNIGYDLSEDWSKKVGIAKARIFFAGTNLFTMSKLKEWGMDPEAPDVYRYYPQQKVYSIGLNITL